jgi:2-C-methyl-D-erythritol 4-phosphate cytidylyltransferase
MNMSEKHISVILPAAGQSKRFGGSRSKLETTIGDRAVLVRAVELFANRPEVQQIIVAVDPNKVDQFKFKWGDKLGFLGVTIVPGGEVERWETVLRAIEAVDKAATHIAVHDAARPVTSPQVIDRCFEAAEQYKAVIPASRITATIKRTAHEASRPEAAEDPLDAILGDAGKTTVDAYRVTETVPRDDLWLIQTPQVFDADLLRRAYRQITDGQLTGEKITDDAGLVEALGEPVHIVEGDPLNVKITHPDDVSFAQAVLNMRKGGSEGLGSKRKFPTWAEMDDE